jgi:hypothetical protein
MVRSRGIIMNNREVWSNSGNNKNFLLNKRHKKKEIKEKSKIGNKDYRKEIKIRKSLEVLNMNKYRKFNKNKLI